MLPSVKPPLSAILFDLDDTLHDDTRTYRRAAERVAETVARERGIAADALLAAYVAQADRFWIELQPSAFGTPLAGVRARMWTAALRGLGIDDPALATECAIAYDRNRRELLELWPGALDLLGDLRARGYKLGMITNGFAETHREKISLLALERAFDEILIADEVGMLKPDPRIFRLAAERLGVAPERCAMVGDRFDRDVVGARDVGMFTIWMNVRDETPPAGAVAPHVIVRDLAGVVEALR